MLADELLLMLEDELLSELLELIELEESLELLDESLELLLLELLLLELLDELLLDDPSQQRQPIVRYADVSSWK